MDFAFVAAGLLLLLMGGGWLVSGAVAVAARLGLSPLVIGVTLVGMGTSAPELLTSLRAAHVGAPDLALGNVVGSNIANILLILGVAAVIAPIAVPRAVWRRDGLVLLAVTLAGALWLGVAAGLGRFGGAVFLAVFAAWMVWQIREGGDDEAVDQALPLGRALALAGVGLAALMLGADLLVRGGTGLARAFGISEAVIGLTVVAVGTSLPELATSVMAARRGRSDLALGNVLGSNVFNLLFILGTTAVYAPLAAAPRFAQVDLPVMAAAVVAMLVVAFGGRIGRWAGAALLVLYGLYLWAVF
ncbi:calcium/sodium antiporter [Jannaschia pohangensis]|uniref:Cation:H+ antiporter n=1 Tax=Jannaschia pohangensis TaxID=390807 RepID=A0A1I3M3M9_9RHOB|nr:calcium/sodium antiporter [Jannaschia pohangensis]SFI91316.1 cation:H+ antiporter [Jannaschia pohangensis]